MTDAFRDDSLARAMAAEERPAAATPRASLYRDAGLVRRLVEDWELTDGSLCVGFLLVEDAPVRAVYAWHGLRIPAALVEDRARLTPDEIEAEDNIELRRVMLEIFGFDAYIAARGALVVAEDECLGLPAVRYAEALRS